MFATHHVKYNLKSQIRMMLIGYLIYKIHHSQVTMVARDIGVTDRLLFPILSFTF